jgi:hypothetical protein
MDRVTWAEKNDARNDVYFKNGMICTGIDAYSKLRMARNVAFSSVQAMLEDAYDRAANAPGSWQIVAQAFVQDDAISVEGFMAVDRNGVLYTPYSPNGYDYDVVKECKARNEKPEKVIKYQLSLHHETRMGMVKTSNTDREKVINTLLDGVFSRLKHS